MNKNKFIMEIMSKIEKYNKDIKKYYEKINKKKIKLKKNKKIEKYSKKIEKYNKKINHLKQKLEDMIELKNKLLINSQCVKLNKIQLDKYYILKSKKRNEEEDLEYNILKHIIEMNRYLDNYIKSI